MWFNQDQILNKECGYTEIRYWVRSVVTLRSDYWIKECGYTEIIYWMRSVVTLRSDTG